MMNQAIETSPLSTWWRHGLILVMVIGFAVLSFVTVKTYTNAPPIPGRVTDERGASGGSGQEPGQQRIFLAHGLVADDGHFTIAWGGDKGDDSTALEEAQDTLAGASHERLDLLLGGGRRGVKHLPLAVAVWRVQTVEEEDVQMGVKANAGHFSVLPSVTDACGCGGTCSF